MAGGEKLRNGLQNVLQKVQSGAHLQIFSDTWRGVQNDVEWIMVLFH